jgi:hypothetical protein
MVVSGKRKEASQFYKVALFIGSRHSPGETGTAAVPKGMTWLTLISTTPKHPCLAA